MFTEDIRKKQFEDFQKNYHEYKNRPFKMLLFLYKGHFGKLLGSLIFYIIKSSPLWIIPLITANVINFATNASENTLDDLWFNAVILIVVLAQNIPMHIFYIKFISNAIRDVEANLRSTLVRKLQILSISYHKELKSGKLQSKVLRDVEAIEMLSKHMMMSLIPAILSGGIAIGIVIHKSSTVALFFLFTVPLSALLITFFRKHIRKTNRQFRQEIEVMSGKVSEMVQMIPITRAHALEEEEITKIDRQLEQVKNRGLKLDLMSAYFGSSSWVTFQLSQAVCLIFTGYLAYKGQIKVGDIAMYQGFFGQIIGQVAAIINIYPQLAKGFESMNSISEVVLADDVEDNQGKQIIRSVEGSFEFCNVNFSYNESEEHAIKDFDLNVKKGEVIALVGESGAGKSTILNLIIGYNRPTNGQIRIDGQDMANIDLRTYRKYMSVVPQNTILFSGTIRDNITYGLGNVSDAQINSIIQMANLTEFIDSLPEGLDTLVSEQGGNLSGGQKQRIAIARALIRDPRIIILDEATSALDNVSEFKVQKAMEELVKGRTTFIVAHRLSTIRHADRIVVMKDGELIEIGNYKELLDQRGEFFKLHNIHNMNNKLD
ncbi:ABC transporter ATP-binding protein [Haloplasma contractile]|uniref:ATP-binding cassette subfamily B bacterial MsbA protein n=1 Tax=Haloplasma contractile SSD-17B TaxID=1033810 RepID=U2FKV0_9MOLU|nr:ABC transporter ATP-binding protein [Haloplasma contractile]ERJ13410.1 ATP-binding cassette subfamily B bacterial MsbA protein [Haloplasma contractile SSD-17B]